MLGDVINDKALAVSFKTSQITLEVLTEVIKKLLQERTKEKTGKQSLKDLRKKGCIEEVDLKEESLKRLQKFLRKYNVDYSIIKDTSQEKTYSLFFRNYDAEILDKAMNNFLSDKFKEKESIKDKIERAKAKSRENTREKLEVDKNLSKRSEKEI